MEIFKCLKTFVIELSEWLQRWMKPSVFRWGLLDWNVQQLVPAPSVHWRVHLKSSIFMEDIFMYILKRNSKFIWCSTICKFYLRNFPRNFANEFLRNKEILITFLGHWKVLKTTQKWQNCLKISRQDWT